MGRRGVSVQEHSRWVFNRLAEAYRARPGYPEPLIQRLFELSGGGRVADLGAGTGLLAIPLAQRGLTVAAVEPAWAMLEVLRGRGEPRVLPVHASAEATTLEPASVGLVVLADSLQWVDPELAGREAARLLRDGGACALVEAHFAGTPFMNALRALLARLNPKARPGREGAGRQVLALATGGGVTSREVFRQDVPLAEERLAAVLQSLSYVGPALGPASLDALIRDAQDLARACGGAVWSRELVLTWARRA